MQKLKSFFIKSLVVAVNMGLVLGGVFFIKNQHEKKEVQTDLATSAGSEQELQAPIDQAVADQAQQLEQIVQQNKAQKTEAVANNPATITVQKPTTVTTTVPAKTKTVSVPVTTTKKSSSTSTKSTPTTTTKKS